jgi:hypothetical protein
LGKSYSGWDAFVQQNLKNELRNSEVDDRHCSSLDEVIGFNFIEN